MVVHTEAVIVSDDMDMQALKSTGQELLTTKLEPSDSPKSRCRSVSAKSTLEPVDEEPHSLTEIRQRSTVDRGTDPDPSPQRPGSKGSSLSSDTRKPMIPQPFAVHGSPLEQSAYHQSLAYYYAVQQVASGLSPLGFPGSTPPGQPLSSNTNEGRYLFNPTFHHPNPARMVGSPTQSDLSLFSNPALASSMDRIAAQMQWDRSQRQLQQLQSPYNLADTSSSKKSMYSDIPATPGSGSVTLPPSLTSSRLTSPRPSVIGGRGRKRALSHSPLSEFLDIQSLTRSSEGSLHLTPLLPNPSNSRSSSASGGSYGHLSAGSLASLTPTALKSASPFLHAAAALYPGLQLHFPPFPTAPAASARVNLTSNNLQRHIPSEPGTAGRSKMEPSSPSQCERKYSDKSDGSAIVSSTVPHLDNMQPKNDMKSLNPKLEMEEDALEFKETVCKWESCCEQYQLHDDLVKHVNQEHISCNRKSFICRWKDCCRQEKPFKAQYMLVVHMRRHTGEKPHKCQGFPGCNKAYSRLENLKTHMRSHTGERPYLCEFPGCQKAFSNASDRAKHQNRTHSNEKPYACEIDGCSKRYTDPSSLRKHVKTVHGAEFYARKKHKGLDTPGCRTNKSSSEAASGTGGDKASAMEQCLTVTGLGAVEQRVSKDIAGLEQDSSPQSDIDVEINVMKTDINMNTNVLNTLHEEITVDGDEYDQLEDADASGEGLVLRRATQPNPNKNLKSRLAGKSSSIACLPSLPNVLGTNRHKLNNLKDFSSQGHSKQTLKSRKLPEIIEPASSVMQQSGTTVPRRDSNTSTLSSYMSSLRSDASPAMFNSRFSSRRSSEASQNSNRFSIINSPYEYDMTGNLPEHKSKELQSMTEKMERARLGSQPNLCVQSQSINLHSPSTRRDRYGRVGAGPEGWRTATPAHTPLPHEYPQYERRRASDPVRCVDPSFNELKKLQHRYHSLNTMKPLPGIASTLNPSRPLRGKHFSQETFQSSRSSLATNGFEAADFEANLDTKMIEDNEDVIIPDDMKQFLLQQKLQNASIQQGVTTPRASNSIDEWVQQTNTINHHINGYDDRIQYNRNIIPMHQYPYQGMNPPAYMPVESHHHTQPYPGQGSNPCYANGCVSNGHNPMCYSDYTNQRNYQMPGVCQELTHQQTMLCHHHHVNTPYNPHSVMPPPTNNGFLQVRTAANNRIPCHNGYVSNNHQSHPPQHNQTQISPPCEVTSSTDPQCQTHPAQTSIQPPLHTQVIPPPPHAIASRAMADVHLHENILDNISTISAADIHSQTSLNFSSVSQRRQPPAESASNMVINNMSNVLTQYVDENKYLNHQH